MKNSILFLLFIIFCIFSLTGFKGGAYAAATSTSYTIPVQIIDLGGAADISSESYLLTSKMRETYRDFKTSEAYSIEDRFMGMVSSTLVVPTITPNQGTTGNTYIVIVNGANFSAGNTSVVLRVAGKTDILATLVTVESSTSLECTINLTNAPTGKRDVIVTVPGAAETLQNGFTIISSGPVTLTKLTNYPNPFNPNTGVTTIEYTLSKDATIDYYLFDQLGEVVWHKTCPAGDIGGSAGDNKVTWNGNSDFSEGVPTGVYVLVITAASGDRELARLKIAVLRQ